MKIYQKIENEISIGDIYALRQAVGSICYTSRDFSSSDFDEAVAYFSSKVPGFMDDHLDGELVSDGKSSFVKSDFTKAVFMLKENFCKERIADVKKIGRAVYGQKKLSSPPSPPRPQTTPGPKHTPEGTHPNSPSHRKTSSRQSQSDMNWLPVAIGAIAVIWIIILIFNLLK